jgi:hypothetical protein
MKKTALFGLLSSVCLLTCFNLKAQEKKDEPTFFTGLSPVILERNAAEINLINSMNSYWIVSKQFKPEDPTGFILDRKRFTRTEHILRASYGFSKNKRWDLGVELKFSQARLDEAARSSPFRVFGNETGSGTSYRGLSGIGLRLRTQPFNKYPELTVQATVLYPQISVQSSESERAQLDAQSVQTGISATYYLQSGENTYYFFQADWAMRLQNQENKRTKHAPSLSATMVFRTWEEQWFVFGGLNYGMSLQQFADGGLYRLSQALFASGGVFYQPTPKFSVVLSIQLPLLFESNLRSIDLPRESFTGFTLGMRSLLGGGG